MFQKYHRKSYEIIIILIAFLILPVNGNPQTKSKKITSNKQNIQKFTSKKKQIKKTKIPLKQLAKSIDPSTKIKELEKKLLVKETELVEIKKVEAKKDVEINNLNENIKFLLDSVEDLNAKLYLQIDTSKKYKELVNCYRVALFNWYNMNNRKGLTEQDHWAIKVELRRSLFNCPPMEENHNRENL
tara:strand:+ start:500 stop:1057 length:558 start_codon:yes stop_codon:yes gene_type:complete